MTCPERACLFCNGTGRVKLIRIYADTLKLLKKHGEACGAELAEIDGCTGPAMNNRLAYLESFGLATSRRYGRMRIFKAVTREVKP